MGPWVGGLCCSDFYMCGNTGCLDCMGPWVAGLCCSDFYMCYFGEEMFYVGSHYVDHNFYLVTGVIFYMGQNFLLGFKIFVWVKILCMGQTFLCRSDFFCVGQINFVWVKFFFKFRHFFFFCLVYCISSFVY